MIKRIKKFIKKWLGEVIFIIGTGLFIYNIFNFSYITDKGLCRARLGCREIEGVVYYYNNDTLLLVSIGAMLIVAGVLIIRNK